MSKHKLSLLDRLRGWHWSASPWLDFHGRYIGTIWTRRRNWCGCEINE